MTGQTILKLKFKDREDAEFFMEETQTYFEQHLDWEMLDKYESEDDKYLSWPWPKYNKENLVIDFRRGV